MEKKLFYPKAGTEPLVSADGYVDYRLSDIIYASGFLRWNAWLTHIQECDVPVIFVVEFNDGIIYESHIYPVGRVSENVIGGSASIPVEDAVIRYFAGDNRPFYVSCNGLQISSSDFYPAHVRSSFPSGIITNRGLLI